MKTIEEMIATYTPEEWRKIIKEEMDELGLCFSKDTEYQKENLFEDLNGQNNDYFAYQAQGACEQCPNNPNNGGSGICHCILGSPVIY